MRGLTSNFISNSIGSPAVPVSINIGWSCSTAGGRRSDPRMDFRITQHPVGNRSKTMHDKYYVVETTPNEMRQVAMRMLQVADEADKACGTKSGFSIAV